MPSNQSIDQHRKQNQRLSALVVAQLERFFRSLDITNPELAREALLAFLPGLIASFGAMAESIALDWYDEMRFESGDPGAYVAIAPPPVDLTPAVEGSIRFAVGHLFRGNPEQTLSDLQTSMHKYAREPGRQAIIWNAENEGARWARIPRGEKTCSFCLVLASRGAEYVSEKSAGSDKFGEENTFHGECDCEVVRFGLEEEYPEGYIPAELYNVYSISADAVGSRNDLKKILYDLRRRFPDAVKDGVVDDDYLAQTG